MTKRKEPTQVTEDVALKAIDPHWNWKRPLQAPGHTNVDFETRVGMVDGLARLVAWWRAEKSAGVPSAA